MRDENNVKEKQASKALRALQSDPAKNHINMSADNRKI